MSGAATAIWHDVECGSYAADLPLWEELAERCGGPVLELGCGTGRVALHLARRGHEVFELESPASLVLAPTHLLQLLADAGERAECLRCVAASLRPGGLLAAAIIEELPEPDGAPPPLPDVREVDGWVYSSLATEVAVGPGELLVRRLRQTVSPQGSLSEEPNEVRIATFAAAALESEAAAFGLAPAGRHEIPPTDLHVGSLVVLLERAP